MSPISPAPIQPVTVAPQPASQKPSLRLRLLTSVLSFAVAPGGFGPGFSAAWAQSGPTGQYYQPAPQPGYQPAPQPGGPQGAPQAGQQEAPDPPGGGGISPRPLQSGGLH